MDNKDVNSIVKEIKDIDSNVTGVIVPILRDTVADYRKIVFKLIIVIVVLIMGIIGLGVTTEIIISKQVERYNDFLSQFEFETEDSDYIQDLDTHNGGDAIINDGININK